MTLPAPLQADLQAYLKKNRVFDKEAIDLLQRFSEEYTALRQAGDALRCLVEDYYPEAINYDKLKEEICTAPSI